MKKILTILLLIQVQVLLAGTQPTLVASQIVPDVIDGSAPFPVENQVFNLWQFRLCGGSNTETDLIVSGNEVLFFVHDSGLVSSPCPPHYYSIEAQANGLAAGDYNLSFYLVSSGDVFPPVAADYPLYLIEQSQFNVVPDRLMVSPSTADSIIRETLPLEGQAFRLWDFLPHWSCRAIDSTQVSYVGNEINVLVLDRASICADPIPPINFPVAGIQVLEAGDYQINYYIVPEGNTFPPAIVDYPSYFIESKAFSVLQAHNVDSLSKSNLIILFSVVLLLGLFMVRIKT